MIEKTLSNQIVALALARSNIGSEISYKKNFFSVGQNREGHRNWLFMTCIHVIAANVLTRIFE